MTLPIQPAPLTGSATQPQLYDTGCPWIQPAPLTGSATRTSRWIHPPLQPIQPAPLTGSATSKCLAVALHAADTTRSPHGVCNGGGPPGTNCQCGYNPLPSRGLQRYFLMLFQLSTTRYNPLPSRGLQPFQAIANMTSEGYNPLPSRGLQPFFPVCKIVCKSDTTRSPHGVCNGSA